MHLKVLTHECAYSVAKYLGLNTNDYSLTYLYSWSKNRDFKEIDESFNTIVNYSKRIINNFEKFYNRDLELSGGEMSCISV